MAILVLLRYYLLLLLLLNDVNLNLVFLLFLFSFLFFSNIFDFQLSTCFSFNVTCPPFFLFSFFYSTLSNCFAQGLENEISFLKFGIKQQKNSGPSAVVYTMCPTCAPPHPSKEKKVVTVSA